MNTEYQILKKAGPLRNGSERGKGTIWHAVPADQYEALCGQAPAIQWSDGGAQVTCPRCIKKLAVMDDERGVKP